MVLVSIKDIQVKFSQMFIYHMKDDFMYKTHIQGHFINMR